MLLDVGTIAVSDFSDGINQKALLSIETAILATQELMETITPTTQGIIEMASPTTRDLIKATTPTTQELIEATTPTNQELIEATASTTEDFIETTTTTQRLVNMTNPTTGKFAEMSTSEIGVSRDSTSLSSREMTGLRTRNSSEMQTAPESSFKGTASSKNKTTTSNTRVEGSEAAVYTTHRETEPDRVTGAAGEPDTHATYSTAQPGIRTERTTESEIVASTSDMYESPTKRDRPRSPVTIGLERDHPLGTTSTLDNLHEEQKEVKSNNFHIDESELQHSILQYEVSCTQAGYNSMVLFALI